MSYGSDGLPEFSKGALLAEHLKALVRGLRRSRIKVQEGGPLKVERGADGDIISYVAPRSILAAITGGTNPYSWQQKIRTSGTTTVDGPLSGTTLSDPAYEESGNASVPANALVRARRDPQTGVWTFPWCY